MPTDQELTMRTNYTTTETRTADFERLHDRAVADSPMVSGRGLTEVSPRPSLSRMFQEPLYRWSQHTSADPTPPPVPSESSHRTW